MIRDDVIVYAGPNGRDYVALFERHGWQRWPAVREGWLSRQGCAASLVESCEELPPRLGELALKLSGVTDA